MTNSRIIRIMLWLPLICACVHVGWKFAYSFLYIHVYLGIGGLAGDDLLRMASPLLYYGLFLYWALPRLRDVEDADVLRSLAFRVVTGFALIMTAMEMLVWLLGGGWQHPGSVVVALPMFVILWFAGFTWMALVSIALGLRWLVTEAVKRLRTSGVTHAT